MNLEELQKEAEKDSHIDDLSLDIESLKIPNLKSKWLRYHSHWSLLVKKTKSDFNVLKLQKTEYYGGKATAEVYRDNPFDHKVLKADIPLYLDGDEDMNNLKNKIAYYEQCVYVCTEVITELTWRHQNIKNSIDWKRFTEGTL